MFLFELSTYHCQRKTQLLNEALSQRRHLCEREWGPKNTIRSFCFSKSTSIVFSGSLSHASLITFVNSAAICACGVTILLAAPSAFSSNFWNHSGARNSARVLLSWIKTGSFVQRSWKPSSRASGT